MGLKKCILPETCLEGLKAPEGMQIIGVRTLRQAVNAVLSKDRNKGQAQERTLDWESEAAV